MDPPVRLGFTFVWEEPDPDDLETRLTCRFATSANPRRSPLTQGPFKTEDRRALHRDGWTDSLDKLERLLANQTA